MRSVKTFTATIYVGTKRERYSEVRPIDIARNKLQEYVNRVGFCVTLTPTEYIYTNGSEPGFAIGLINYPRFPADMESIRGKAIEIALEMLETFEQFKVSIVFPDETVMLEKTDASKQVAGQGPGIAPLNATES